MFYMIYSLSNIQHTQLHQIFSDRCMNYIPPVLPTRVRYTESFVDFVTLYVTDF